MSSTTTDCTVQSINDLPDELLRIISISAGPIEYCNFRRAMKRVWEYTTGREDHCIKHFLITKVNSASGATITTLCGKYHGMFDQPAVIRPDGTQFWYQHDELHRDNDRPAIIYSGGSQEWYQHGELHRDNDLPAGVHSDGSRVWHRHGVNYFP